MPKPADLAVIGPRRRDVLAGACACQAAGAVAPRPTDSSAREIRL